MPRRKIPFEQCYTPIPMTGCWIWLRGFDRDGYGKGSNNLVAHRWSYQIHKGPIPIGMAVCHSCDVRACVNRDHLFLGTNQDNTADRHSKSRDASGESSGSAKLTPESVTMIRSSIEPSRLIAKRLGVTHRTVLLARRGATWKSVTA